MISIINSSLIKVPETIKIYCCNFKNLIVIKGRIGTQMYTFPVKIYVLKNQLKNFSYLFITRHNINNNNYRIMIKKNNIVQSDISSKIKNSIQLVSRYAFIKLKLIGIGYKIFLKEYKNIKILHLKAGYSHDIYFKIPLEFDIKLSNNNMLFIAGFSKNKVSEFATYIRSFKVPEPYKGKGIRYEDEKVILKVGKKV